MRALRRTALGAVLVWLLVIAAAGPALAHEVRTVGNYVFTVGWRDEPTFVGQPNAVQCFVHDLHGHAVSNLAPGQLTVVVSTVGQTMARQPLLPAFDPDTGLGNPSEYDAAIIPTAVGDYTFHISGSVHGQKINQSFTSGPSTFNTVEDPTPIEFPSQDPPLPEVVTRVERDGARVVAARAAAAQASTDANNAKTTAYIAIGIAVVSLALAVGFGVAYLRGRRQDPTPSDRAA